MCLIKEVLNEVCSWEWFPGIGASYKWFLNDFHDNFLVKSRNDELLLLLEN